MASDTVRRRAILTVMFSRQIPRIEVGNGKKYLHPKNPLDVLVGHSDGRLGKQVTSFNRHTKTLVVKFGKMTDPKLGGI